MPIALAFFVHYAYLILFLWVLMEQIGIPIPSIPVLLTAGTLTATHRIHHIYVLLAVLGACLIADTIWFSRRGAVTLLFAKFVPGLSTVAAPIAGQTGMSFGRFFLWDVAGSLIWAESFILAGRFFGDLAKKSAPFFHWLGHFAIAIFVLMVLGFLAYRILKQRKFLQHVRELRLEPSELKDMLDAAEKNGNIPPFIVDLRHPLDYLPDPRVLPGALRIGPNELKLHNEIIPRDRDVILYCTCPSEETSAKLALQLHKMGVYRVRPLRGGFDGWKQAGYPLVDYVTDVPTSPVVQVILPSTPSQPLPLL
jgi:membrane protein DedA with SNARE-associated domain/rhodanese-related sulfurtransferase